jgi:hypothetical protein
MSSIDVVISVISFVLFFYWFQYVCLLILSARTSHDYSREIAAANQLRFPEVQARLRAPQPDLEGLHRSLERDYAIVTALLRSTSGFIADERREMALLKIHYRTMSAWFWLTRAALRQASIQALEEMSLVLIHMANTIGERTGNAGDPSGIYTAWKHDDGCGSTRSVT